MSVAKQLYQLQEVDLEIESDEQTLKQVASQLGESQAVVKTRAKLASESQHLEELGRQQHSIEWEIDDLTGKLTTLDQKLYSGKISNPKELTNLQHEVDGLKAKRNQLEDKTLDIMELVEATTARVNTLDSQLGELEAEWHRQQQQLSADMEQLKTTLSYLGDKRELLLAEIDKIDPQAAEFYHELKKQKGKAVARVVQGICRGCRISLPSIDLQRARGGSLVQCSSCGRILFLD